MLRSAAAARPALHLRCVLATTRGGCGFGRPSFRRRRKPGVEIVEDRFGTFTGEMTLPDGTVIAPTGKAFDVEFGQTTKWEGDQLIVISAFYDAAVQRQQIGLAQ